MLILENNCSYLLTFKKNLPIGIIDAKYLRHFHCQNENLTKTLSTNYHIISAHHIQTVMNDVKTEMINAFHKNTAIDESTTGVKDPFPWLDPEDPQRHMSDEEILDLMIDLSKSALSPTGKKELMSIVHKHKKAFSL